MRHLEFCRSCDAPNPETFLDLGDQPFANGLTDSPDEPVKAHPLALAQCGECSLVQLTYTADPKELFSNYLWVTGTSPLTREYALRFRDTVVENEGLTPASGYVLEAAGNDGTFLKPFIAKGFEVLSVEPATNIAEAAVEAGVPTINDFFNEETALAILAEKGAPGLVMARNVLAHVADLHGFVKGLALLAEAGAPVVVEAHYGGAIAQEIHYDSIYHEHLCYFTLYSLTRLLERFGLKPYDCWWSPINGGSFAVVSRVKPKPETPAFVRLRAKEEQAEINDAAVWRAFADASFAHRDKLVALVKAEKDRGRSVVGYGASARSSTMLNFCGLDCGFIDAIADAAPLKQGKFTAGTRIPILAPETVFAQKPDVVLVQAWNFFDEIVSGIRDRFGFSGGLIKPLPHPPIALDMRDFPRA